MLETVVSHQDSSAKGDAAAVTEELSTLHLGKEFWKQIQNHLKKHTAEKHKKPHLTNQT